MFSTLGERPYCWCKARRLWASVSLLMVGGKVMPLALRGGLAASTIVRTRLTMDEKQKPSKVRYFLVVQYGLSTGQKTFFSAAATSSNHTFYSFRQFFNFLRTVFKYGLLFMVSREVTMEVLGIPLLTVCFCSSLS